MNHVTFLVSLLAATAGCGGDKVHHLGDAPPAGDAATHTDGLLDVGLDGPPDAFACGGQCCVAADCPSANDACSALHQCVDVTGSLSGLSWKLPCGADTSSVACAAGPTTTAMATLGGTAGITYDVTVHLRGVVEQKTYTGGCQSNLWLTGGASNGDPYNIYQLTISSPPQTYFLNAGVSNNQYVDVLDYVQTFKAEAGATITLFADAVDGAEIKNIAMVGGGPVMVDGVPPALVAQPYAGQFIAMEVTNVVPDPVAAASPGTGTPGGAISVAGGQQVTIADSVSLEPASALTLEAWATFDGATGSYQSVAGKPFGGGSTDSFTLWTQGGTLNAGVAISSTSGTANVPFAVASGVWHHLAMTYDNASTVTTLFVDGLPVSCATGQPAPSYDTHPFLIGGDIDNGTPMGFWSGAIDEVRLFATARTRDQIWADMHVHQLGATTGLVGEWTFDEGTGQTTADTSGSGNAGVLGSSSGAIEANDPTWIVSTVPH